MKFLKIFKKKTNIKKIKINYNIPDTIIEAMKILENKGITIKTIEVTKELAKRMTSGREAIDRQFKKDPVGLLYMDDEFAPFLNKEIIINKMLLRTKPKGFIGMMFGINIITKEVGDGKK